MVGTPSRTSHSMRSAFRRRLPELGPRGAAPLPRRTASSPPGGDRPSSSIRSGMECVLLIVHNPLVDFLAMHGHLPRPFDADLHLALADLQDAHFDIVGNADRFTLFASKKQHVRLLVLDCFKSYEFFEKRGSVVSARKGLGLMPDDGLKVLRPNLPSQHLHRREQALFR